MILALLWFRLPTQLARNEPVRECIIHATETDIIANPLAAAVGQADLDRFGLPGPATRHWRAALIGSTFDQRLPTRRPADRLSSRIRSPGQAGG